jgi:hypothetical protein
MAVGCVESRWRPDRFGRARLAALCVSVALPGALLGCASTAARTGEPPAGAHPWVCDAVEGTAAEPWYGAVETWREDAGVMSSVHGTAWGDGGPYGRPTEEEALREALTSAASAALDLLERRGLTYRSDRRAELETRTVERLLEGGEPSFPRVRIGGRVVERCRDEETGENSWRAKVLVQYPIGELKGDVVNAMWERERILGEVEVLRASASAYFAGGRWLDGRLDLERALDLLDGAGTSLRDVPSAPEPTAPWEGSRPTQAERVWWEREQIDGTRADLSVEPLGVIDVVEIGARAGAEAAFLVTCSWGGGATPAVGVPMRYEVEGDVAAILDGDVVTGENGIARCRILRAYGDPGEYRLVAGVDGDLVRRAGIKRFGTVAVEADGPGGGATSHRGAPEASQRLFLVRGGHGVTICAELTGDLERDASQARAGLVQRMAGDGFLVGPCGPEVDVVVSGAVRTTTVVVPGSWTAEVTIEGSAFDQRYAREVGETMITVAEESGEGQRDAELRALREAGRLLAVYLSERILTSGE